MADYQPPIIAVEYAPGFSPTNLPTNTDFVPLELADGATRLVAFESTKGRRDRFETFEPGTATFVLDNTDGELDEYEPGTLVYGADGQPWTPIRMTAQDPLLSSFFVRTIWTGFITSGWEPTPPQERVREVTVQAVDWMGWAAQRSLPDSMLASFIKNYDPTVWWRGRLTEPRISTSSGEVVDIGSEGLTADMQYGEAEMTDALVPGSDDPAIRLFTGARVTTSGPASSGIGPGRFWGLLVFQIADLAGVGRDILVGRATSPTSSQEWAVRVGTTGHIAFEGIGGTATITEPHNDGRPHLVAFFSDFLNSEVYVSSDLGSASNLSGSALTQCWLTTSGATTDARILVDEVAYFVGSPAIVPDLASMLEGGDDTSYWATDTLANRLDRLCQFADVTVPSGYFEPYVTPGSNQVGGYTVQPTLADGIQAAAEALMGGAFVSRPGNVQVYSYNDIAAVGAGRGIDLSTEDPLPAGKYRFSGGQRSGRKLDRVINEVRTASGAILATDAASIAKYEVQPLVLNTNATGATAVGFAQDIVDARKEPTAEIGDVILEPWGDQELTTKVIMDLDLCGTCTIELGADHNGAPAWSFPVDNGDPCQILAESWSMSDGGSNWTVTLTIG